MKVLIPSTFLILVTLTIFTNLSIATPKINSKKIILKTCEGCALTHYPNVVKFIKYDVPRYNDEVLNQIKTNYDAGGNPRFVILDSEGEIERVLNIAQLSLKQIRLVAKKLGFRPLRELMSLKEVTEQYLLDKSREDEIDSNGNGVFDEALGLNRHDKIEQQFHSNEDLDLVGNEESKSYYPQEKAQNNKKSGKSREGIEDEEVLDAVNESLNK